MKMDILTIFAYEEIIVSESCDVILWSFTIIEGVSFGYLYVKPHDYENNLSRAYDIIFEETLKRLESKGIHLSLQTIRYIGVYNKHMEFKTRKEVAEFFRVNPRTVERWLKSGKLKGYKLGRGKTAPWRIDMAEIKKFLLKNKV